MPPSPLAPSLPLIILLVALRATAAQAASLPTTLGWFDVSGQQLQNVCPPVGDNQPSSSSSYNFPFYCQNVIKSWSSGIADTTRNRMLIWGGGHNDYYGNEVYAFDLNTLQLTRLNHPSPTAPLNNPNCGPETLSDGTPNSRHTYGGLTYIAHTDQMYVYGGGVAAINGCGSDATWTLNLATLQWTRKDPTLGNGPVGNEPLLGAVSAYDPNTKLVFLNGRNCFYSYSEDSNTYARLQCSGDLTLHTQAVIDPKRKLFFTFGDGIIRKINITLGSNYAVSNPPGSGCSALASAGSPGLAYDPTLDRIVGWPNFGNTLYLYNPDSDSCTTQTFAGGPPDSAHLGPAPSSAGTFGRFQYFPALGVYVVVNDWNIDAHVLRLTDGVSPPPPPTCSPCDVNCDGVTNVADVQLEVNMALGVLPCTNPSGTCTVVSVQRVVNAALGGQCVSP